MLPATDPANSGWDTWKHAKKRRTTGKPLVVASQTNRSNHNDPPLLLCVQRKKEVQISCRTESKSLWSDSVCLPTPTLTIFFSVGSFHCLPQPTTLEAIMLPRKPPQRPPSPHQIHWVLFVCLLLVTTSQTCALPRRESTLRKSKLRVPVPTERIRNEPAVNRVSDVHLDEEESNCVNDVNMDEEESPHPILPPTTTQHRFRAAATTAARTFFDEASQRSGLLQAIPALQQNRRRLSNTNNSDNSGEEEQQHLFGSALCNHQLYTTWQVVNVKTKQIRQHIGQHFSGPDTGSYYGLTPKLLQKSTTHTSNKNKPLAMRDAVTLTLGELRSMRQDMEALRQEIRALKRDMLGDAIQEDDPEVLHKQRRKKQREYDRIGREVERWAEHLLFEQDGEVDGWKSVECNKVLQSSFNPDGRTVAFVKWMKDSRGSHANPDDDREYPCLKLFSTIDAPLEVVCQYLSDERKMTEYNDLVVKHKELEEISPHSKICWGQTPAILFIQPRDFITFCHHRWLRDGTAVVVNQACDTHENFTPQNPQAYALRGANFVSRHPQDPSKTRIAMLAHASPGPDIPHWASKTAVKALVPIEPFKLFHKINQGVAEHRQELEQALPPAELVQDGGRSGRPAGIAQMGYACFWPQGGGLQEEGGPLDTNKDPMESMREERESERTDDSSSS